MALDVLFQFIFSVAGILKIDSCQPHERSGEEMTTYINGSLFARRLCRCTRRRDRSDIWSRNRLRKLWIW